MSEMISVASGFQYSVNIEYDLNDDNKLRNFIPTKSALGLLEDILLSTKSTSTDRARILIGAYGKGKSHIVLVIMAMLMRKDVSLFEKALPMIKESPQLDASVKAYYESGNKILPIVVSGSNTSLTQAFLIALQHTLAENDLLDIMPETNYKAAIHTIMRWKEDFPDTYEKFKNELDIPASSFIEELEDFNITAYEKFERIYPSLTAGSLFNPFLGFNVVELYESVVKSLVEKGFTGIYVIYDEFSKFLEANISEASVSDTKMLQDFAEKCNRSGSLQMHIMLISHKEIANYIDTLPKQKVDGWRGVSERFTHVRLDDNFSQMYEIIASVIQKSPLTWEHFCRTYEGNFGDMVCQYKGHPIFSDLDASEVKSVILSCYPLHPVSIFILPRLSERIAQNERTLFTFLSADGVATLPSFLEKFHDREFSVITPDLIYDYFEPLLRKEVYSGELYSIYQITTVVLSKIEKDGLEAKIIKTIALIYILAQFEKLAPTRNELVGIFSTGYTVSEIEAAIWNLVEEEYVVFFKRSNGYLQLKQTSGVDVYQKIHDTMASPKSKLSVKDTLNRLNYDCNMYPSRYNDEKEMTRYFPFLFIDAAEVASDTDWAIKAENIPGDGVVYGIIPSSAQSLDEVRGLVLPSSARAKHAVFVLPKKYCDITDTVSEFNAVSLLREAASNDIVLFNEYDVIYEDLREVIGAYIKAYTQPETYKSDYIYYGEKRQVRRKAALTSLLSDVCDEVFSKTPVINNEAINKDDITSIAYNSRSKIISGLLRNEIEVGLGLTGTGQEVSIMRSTLIRTGVLCEENGAARINLFPDDPNLANVFATIIDFIREAQQKGQVSFAELYLRLTKGEYHIGLRKGLIPIYLAAALHEFKQNVFISDRSGQVSTSTDTLLQINSNPSAFFLAYLDWNPEKERFVSCLASLFREHVVEEEKFHNAYDYVVRAMRRWYMALPKYSKEMRKTFSGSNVEKRYLAFTRLLRQNIGSNELLFQRIPVAFGYAAEFTPGVAENILAAKNFYDSALTSLREGLKREVKELFSASNTRQHQRASISSTIRDWCDSLDATVFEHLFSDGTEKCLALLRTVTNDDDTFIARLAKVLTDLRLEDWDDNTHDRFTENIKRCKENAERYHSTVEEQNSSSNDSNYQVTFVNEDGDKLTRRFERVDISKRGGLLLNAIVSDMESMGRSISEQEKRQVLMEILKKMC